MDCIEKVLRHHQRLDLMYRNADMPVLDGTLVADTRFILTKRSK